MSEPDNHRVFELEGKGVLQVVSRGLRREAG